MLNRAGVLASEDSDAFDAVMDSFGLPKSTDDEKDARRTAIRSAMMTIASVPFETATAMNLLQVARTRTPWKRMQ